MINIIYQRLFNLKVTHTFYKSGLAKGVKLVPTSETAELLLNGKMLLKYLPHQMTVLYRGRNETPPVDPPNPFIDLGKDFKLTFALSVANKSEFVNITDLDSGPDTYQSGQILYFKNDPASADSPEVISHTLIDSLRSSLFTYPFALAAATGDVDFILLKINDDGTETKVPTGKDVDGNDLPLEFTLKQFTDNSYSHSVDARNLTFGRYKIKITTSGVEADVKLEELIYIHDQLASQDVLGIVDLIYDTANDKAYGATEEYDIHFESKKTRWKYLIVNKNKKVDFSGGESLKIVDDSTVVASKPYQINTFATSGVQPHASIALNGLETVVLLSDQEIPFFEEPKLDIQLLKDPDDVKLVTHLPNPFINGNVKKEGANAASEIYVFL